MKLLACLLLLLHVNYTMLIPSVDEVDVYDAHGVLVDDINSVYEFVDQVVLGHTDHTPEDEDDDQAHYSCFAKTFCYVHQIQRVSSEAYTHDFEPASVREKFLDAQEQQLLSITRDIDGPPPKS